MGRQGTPHRVPPAPCSMTSRRSRGCSGGGSTWRCPWCADMRPSRRDVPRSTCGCPDARSTSRRCRPAPSPRPSGARWRTSTTSSSCSSRRPADRSYDAESHRRRQLSELDRAAATGSRAHRPADPLGADARGRLALALRADSRPRHLHRRQRARLLRRRAGRRQRSRARRAGVGGVAHRRPGRRLRRPRRPGGARRPRLRARELCALARRASQTQRSSRGRGSRPR